MAKRKQTPNVMDNLTGIPVSQNTITPVQSTKTSDEKEKTKATFYISTDTVDALDGAWMKLRGMAKGEKKKEVSKSAIVNVALQIILEDLETNGDESQLATVLVGK